MLFWTSREGKRKREVGREERENVSSQEASRGEKATSTATSKSRIPLCFIPVRKQEESLAFHTGTQREQMRH